MSREDRGPFVSRAGQKLAAALEHFHLDVAARTCADLGSHVGGFVDCLLQRGAAKVYSVDTSYGTLAWKLRRDPRVVVLERTNALHVTLPEPVSLVTIDVGWTKQAAILPTAARLLASGSEVADIEPTPLDPPLARVDGANATGHPAGTFPPYQVERSEDSPRRAGTQVGRSEGLPPCEGGTEGGQSSSALGPAAPAAGSPLSPGERGRGEGQCDVVTLIKPHYEAPKELLTGGVLPDDKLASVVDTVLTHVAAHGWQIVATFESPLRGHGGNKELFAHLRRPPLPVGRRSAEAEEGQGGSEPRPCGKRKRAPASTAARGAAQNACSRARLGKAIRPATVRERPAEFRHTSLAGAVAAEGVKGVVEFAVGAVLLADEQIEVVLADEDRRHVRGGVVGCILMHRVRTVRGALPPNLELC